jgi:hypothetical protein
MDIALGLLASVFFGLVLDTQKHLDIHHLVKMALYSVQFFGHVTAQCGGNFKMVTADR